jgi:3-methylfumaryl-CoA hydratase
MRTLVPDAVMLFRYSALTFNGHRIHYDREYARDIECYPGLVVHGPLIATLLLDHLLQNRRGRRPTHFSFRASSPCFDGEPLVLGFTDSEGAVALRADNPVAPAISASAILAPA